MPAFTTQTFPKSRLATIDILAVGRQKHHIAALLEIDVSAAREKISALHTGGTDLSFTAWIVHVIGLTIQHHPQVAAFRRGKRGAVLFEHIDVSVLVEKEIGGRVVPLPLVVERANERSVESISRQIRDAREQAASGQDIALQRKSTPLERLYYYLPGFLRRWFWRYLLSHPRLAFGKMGNVAVTSVGMLGRARGWFIPVGVHPVCFGISGISKKPVAIDNRVEIREILNLTVLLDHDVVDGAPMARFIGELSDHMERAAGL